jgi:hypothetical protein
MAKSFDLALDFYFSPIRSGDQLGGVKLLRYAVTSALCCSMVMSMITPKVLSFCALSESLLQL